MLKLRLVLVALPLLLAGCNCSRLPDLKFTLAPGATEDSVTITCEVSSTGKCHFLFDGNATPDMVSIDTGTSRTVQQISPGTQYCADTHKTSFDLCSKSTIDFHRVTVEKKISSDNVTS